ncbi:hypothetical protein JKP88DRAFT_227300 [Tribonema minus]|uniref:Uncharacterized protein n=1 Tax=Tribonema minus TaxID=303371 RepID=A0A835YM42_9STRA|nr:hypothetical protein JKP88DRAFT_227300 [Tribonema minus]
MGPAAGPSMGPAAGPAMGPSAGPAAGPSAYGPSYGAAAAAAAGGGADDMAVGPYPDDGAVGPYPSGDDGTAVGPYPGAQAGLPKASAVSKDLTAMVPAHLRMRRAGAAPVVRKPTRVNVVASVPRPKGATLLAPRGVRKAPVGGGGEVRAEPAKAKMGVADEYAAFMEEMKDLGAI